MKSLVPIMLVSLAAAPAFAQTQSPPAKMTAPPAGTQQPAEPGHLPDQGAAASTPEFVSSAESGTQFEIKAAQIALSKTQSPRVKHFAQKMIKDHGKAGQELHRILARDQGAQPPQGAPMPQDETQKLQQLQSASGPDFDRAYIGIMLKDHETDTNMFRTYARGGNDPRIRAFARRTLPVIEGHLRLVEKLHREEASRS